jgi:hypothetical protein
VSGRQKGNRLPLPPEKMVGVGESELALGRQPVCWCTRLAVSSPTRPTPGAEVIADRLAGLVGYLRDVSSVNTHIDDDGSDRCPHSFGGGHHIVRRVYREAVGTKCSGHSRERRPGEQ